MAFTTDYTTENNLLPEGQYECIIKSAYLNATNSQHPTEYFSIRLIVRNDVAQRYQNKNIFHAIWRRKPENRTDDDNKVDGFSYKQIMSLAQAAGLPKGKSYETLDDLGKDLVGKCILVTIEHDTYNNEKREKVKWTNETKFKDCKHVFAENNSNPTPSIQNQQPVVEDILDEITSDDDLPFD